MTDKRQTILVVDDMPDDIVILEEILKRDYRVKAVTNGEAALKIVQSENPPDLILLDVMMPELDGFELCRILKQDTQGALIPVVFLTAKARPADERLGFELGAVDYIKKPVDPEIVRTRIKSQLEQKDQALRFSELRFRRLFETSKDGIVIFDNGTGMVVDANPSMAAILGVSQEHFLGKRVSELEFLDDILPRKEGKLDLERQGYGHFADRAMETLDGRKIHVELIYNSYEVNHREVTQLNVRDITALVDAERERDELSSRLSHYLSTSPTVTYSLALREGAIQWQWVSENILGLLGYSSEEALAPDWWFRNIHTSDRADTLSGIAELVKNDTSVREYRFMRKDRTCVWLRDEMRLSHAGGKDSEIVGTLTDISAQKDAEEEIHLKSAVLDAAANAVLIMDREGSIRWANSAYERMTGYSKTEVIGTKPSALMASGQQDEAIRRKLWDAILSGNVWSGELVNRRKSGECYTEESTITPVTDSSGYISNFVAIMSDVTERKRAQERLEGALREKNELLREIHHRVNNNMQVVISLLNLSLSDIGDEATCGKIEDIKRRVHSMSLIHQQFYESEDLSRIDFAVYLRHLLEGIKPDSPAVQEEVTSACETGEVFLALEQAIPAGLIVDELITNAMRFAFSDGRKAGSIRVTQQRMGNSLEVEVRDDGVGGFGWF
jgi:PAS domain S-box-containing protein